MRFPMVYLADVLIANYKTSTTFCEACNRWVAARPEALSGFRFIDRLDRAWKVFTGKADVLIWHMPKAKEKK